MQKKIKRYTRTTFSSLKIRNYKLYFIGQGVSRAGTWVQTIAQTWLIFQLTGSGTYIGLLTTVQFIPILVLGPLGGLMNAGCTSTTIKALRLPESGNFMHSS